MQDLEYVISWKVWRLDKTRGIISNNCHVSIFTLARATLIKKDGQGKLPILLLSTKEALIRLSESFDENDYYGHTSHRRRSLGMHGSHKRR